MFIYNMLHIVTCRYNKMPTSPRSRTISLRVDLTEKLKNKHNQELKVKPTKTKEDFGGYVNDILSSVLEKDEFLKIYAPSISVIDIVGDVLYLKETKNGQPKTIEVYLKDSELYCESDNSFDCRHVKYAFAIPEVAKLNLKRP